MRLEGKVAIVTGGASGFGAATCRFFAREGMQGVVIADINDVLGRQVAQEIEASGGHACFVKLDVTDESQWREAVAATVGRYGRLDVTVNNAGLSVPESRKKVEETTLEVWNQMHAVNVTGVFLGTKHSIPEMRKVGGGSIINISSIYGIVGSPGSTAYHSSKGAVRTFTKAAAIQYAPENIRVNSIHPGFADTGMTRELHAQPAERQRRISLTPLGRMGTPEDIAWGCVYLAADESSFVTGSELVIDGGMLAQ
jgi:NAD(P)-dependent dehydrogenase (short-subunit alcohol dehydrogenase family)